MKRWLSVLAFFALLPGCSAGGGTPQLATASSVPATATPSPAATPSSAQPMQAMQVSLYVPTASETPDASSRRPTYVSPVAKSLVAHITEPDVMPTALQDRTETHNLSPGFNTITLYAPPGTVTIVLRLYLMPNGAGPELGRSDPDDGTLTNVVLDAVDPVHLTVTIDPIVTGVELKAIDPAPRAPGCKGTTGQAIAVATDQSGNRIFGAGAFLDVNEKYVTYSIAPGSPPDFSSPEALSRVFTTPISIGGVVKNGTTTLPFVESNPAYDENSQATAGNYAWYVTVQSSTIAGPPAPTVFDSLQCLPGIAG